MDLTILYFMSKVVKLQHADQIWPTTFSIKFYWNIVMPIYLYIIYGCFQATAAELSNYNRLYGSQSPKYLLSAPLQKKYADSGSIPS